MLAPSVVQIVLWKKGMKSSNTYKSFQHRCLRQEFKDRYNDSISHEKGIMRLLDHLQFTMFCDDFNLLQKYPHDRSKRIKESTTAAREKKFTKLNSEPVSQNHLTLKIKLILYRIWKFCIETKLTNAIDPNTHLTVNMKKLETTRRELNHLPNKLIKKVCKKKIRNISDDQFKVLMTLKKNQNSIISEADYIKKPTKFSKHNSWKQTNHFSERKRNNFSGGCGWPTECA